MSEKACLYTLRVVRHLQSCQSSVGSQILQTTRRYTSRPGYLGLKLPVKATFLSVYGQSFTPLRCLSDVSSISLGEKDLTSAEEESASSGPRISDHGVPDLFEDKTETNYLDSTEEAESFDMQRGLSRTGRLNNNNPFSKVFLKCVSPSDALDLCGSNSMSSKHISNSFTTMWLTAKNIKQNQGQRYYEKQMMLEHLNFANLCHQAMLAAPEMSSSDLVYTLHSVAKLQLPQNTRLFQTLLRVCQERLNDFREREISVLSSALEELESCGNVDSLRAGLRVLVELRLPEIQRILPLQTMMSCIGKDAPLSLKKKLEKKALEMKDQFTLPNAQHMIICLAAINLPSLPLLNFCKRKIIDEIQFVPFWKVVNILNSCSVLSFRDKELLTAIGDHVLDTINMWQTKKVTMILMQMGSLGFRHVPLLDANAEKVIENPRALTLKDLLIMAKVYSMLNHLPEGRSQQFLDALNTSLQLYLPRIHSFDLLRILFSFFNLGSSPALPLEKLMRHDVLNELLSLGNPNVEQNTRMLHSINLCLQLEQKSTAVPKTLDLVIIPATNCVPHPEVESALGILVEDPTYIQKGLHIFNSYYIDYLVRVDTEHKKVVPLINTPVLDKASQTKRVAVLCFHTSHFAVDSLHLLGIHAMKVRHLQTIDYHVVLVPLHKFRRMDVAERVFFLRNQIFSSGSSTTEEQKSKEPSIDNDQD